MAQSLHTPMARLIFSVPDKTCGAVKFPEWHVQVIENSPIQRKRVFPLSRCR
jgi:hypothetical protein